MPGARAVRTLGLLILALAAGLLLGRTAAAQAPTAPGPAAPGARPAEAAALKAEAAVLVRAGDLEAAQQITAEIARAALPEFYFHQRGG
jgi:hypothetical protein